MTFDEFNKNQDNTPMLWIENFGTRLIDSGVNPDHAVRFLRDTHLGPKTANSLATWLASNAQASWGEFRTAFLNLNPGKPPQITRLTWKALSMKSCGSYHAYLQEFNRQKALIPTGPDEVIEQFLSGLNAPLRNQVAFFKNRNWRAAEYLELVDTTTERVNSSVLSPEQSVVGDVASNKRSRADGRYASAGASKQSKRAAQQGPSKHKVARPHGYVGSSRSETRAISEFCFQNNICKFCKESGHGYKDCTGSMVDFSFPRNWDEAYWLDQAEKSAIARGTSKASQGPRSKK